MNPVLSGKEINMEKEAVRVVELASSEGIIIRIIGGLAVYLHSLHSSNSMEIYNKLRKNGSMNHTDIDLVAYSKQRKQIMEFFEKELRYISNRYINSLFGQKRLVYWHPSKLFYVDIFFDKLEYSHDIFFGDKPGNGRLELDFPTVDLASLVLSKLQIHDINKKDLIDLLILMKAHDFCRGGRDRECIDMNSIASVLADDWGFWFDSMNNLAKLRSYLQEIQRVGIFDSKFFSDVNEKIDIMIDCINNTPKTKNWEKRSKQGTEKIWYREVEEVER
ncbi:MAG TPA: hypothetical protein ENO36_01395 [Fervidicoccus fontis]|uniref:Nucleotidyltransferase family protein n=1 Tax=Fervidicoccus fontis TaxID=683846 RepID=A0A7C2YH39_9CREN|nr:MAG: hypothetical protein C0179_00450 [Fervidicoccus sp.]HEU97497.1 hypothetical protein [Fervidicoccus fontis]